MEEEGKGGERRGKREETRLKFNPNLTRGQGGAYRSHFTFFHGKPLNFTVYLKLWNVILKSRLQ